MRERPTFSSSVLRRIRDLNDEINKLMREKSHWERRIVELGGPDYSRAAPRVTDSRGREVAELMGERDAHAPRHACILIMQNDQHHKLP